jgi:hypothetical protein
MSLSDRERNGWLSRHTTSAQEIGNLLAIVERDLRDSRSDDVSPDWRLNIAYNAVLQAAKAALAASGYRAAKGQQQPPSHHPEPGLDRGPRRLAYQENRGLRKRRNMTEYDQAGVISPDEAGEMRTVAIAVHDTMTADWRVPAVV